MDYRWIISHVGSDYGWAILDANGERVLTGTAPSRVAAVVLVGNSPSDVLVMQPAQDRLGERLTDGVHSA
jgi:hypothetical protein